MVSLRCWCCALGLLLLMSAPGSTPMATAGGIELQLRTTHSWDVQYHTADTDKSAVLHLEIANNTERDVILPPDYDGKVIRLWANSAEQRRPVMLVDWKRKPPAEMHRLGPGKQHQWLALPLHEILARTHEESKWQWHWSARPTPSATPIVPHKHGEYVKAIVLWAEVIVDGQSLRSEPLVIPVITDR